MNPVLEFGHFVVHGIGQISYPAICRAMNPDLRLNVGLRLNNRGAA